MGVSTTDFFKHVEPFMDYRSSVYEISDQTIKSNRTDLKLFENFIIDKQHETITGPAVMDFQYYLKTQRKNCGGSLNRKLFTLRSYSHFLRLQDVAHAERLPFYDVLKVRKFFYKNDQRNALFISKKGNRLAIRTMEDNFKKLVIKSWLKTRFNVTCHTLRHSFASHLNDKEVDMLVIQSLMGHCTSRSTEPYIHPSMQRVRQAMEKLPGVIFMNELIKKRR